MRVPLVVALAGVLLLIPAASPRVATAHPPGLSGQWNLNEEESDDPRAELQKTMRSLGQSMPGRDRAGPGGRGRPGGGRGQGSMQRLMQAAWALSIAQDDSTVTIADADGTRLILYTDNREVYYPMEDLGEVKTRARWKGEKLEVLRDVEDGPKITQTFELKEDGRQMRIRVKIEGGPMPSFSFRRVYDRKVEGN